MSALDDLLKLDLHPKFLSSGLSSIGRADITSTLEKTWAHFQKQKYFYVGSLCQILLDESWEEMNTGHWKDVDINWRLLYSYASLLKCLCLYHLDDVTSAVRSCDMGLLMGAPIMDNILAKIAPKLGGVLDTIGKETSASKNEDLDDNDEDDTRPIKKRRIRESPVINTEFETLKLDCPTMLLFQQNHMKLETPVIIRNAMSHWPAMQGNRWSLSYIGKVAGSRTVPVEVGSQYTSSEWTQKLITMRKFIDEYIIGGHEMGYLAQHQLFNQIPELKEDIIVPDYCCLTKEESGNVDDDNAVMINAWFGPEGTVSPLHHDPYHNLLAQVVGQKYIRLYDRSLSNLLYPHENSIMGNTSKVDVEDWDKEEFPDFGEANYLECVLNEGEMLYIPPKWWHYVRSLAVSFSVSFWWK